MATILIIGPDPETREILRLRFEVDGFEVAAALGKDDALSLLGRKKPDAIIVDMIGYDEEEKAEISSITKKTGRLDIPSVLLLPRGNDSISRPAVKVCELCAAEEPPVIKPPAAHLHIKKPYDLTNLVREVKNLINSPKRSSTSRRGSRRRS